MLRLFITAVLVATFGAVSAQDSVTVSGRILNLTPRLYRQSPAVTISRSNILQQGQERVYPAPLQPDGRFSVRVPLIYPLEELQFSFGRVSTALLAAPGNLGITLNADSLFSASVPFQFSGVNNVVNTAYARYKAFEATQKALTPRELAQRLANQSGLGLYRTLFAENTRPMRAYQQTSTLPSLLVRWLENTARYQTATYFYEKALAEETELAKALDDSLRPARDPLLTSARAVATSRFWQLAEARLNIAGNTALPVDQLAALLLRYGRNLTNAERERLQTYRQQRSARVSDTRFLSAIAERNPDTLRRLMIYESVIRPARARYDSLSLDLVKGSALATALPGLTLNLATLFYQHIRPALADERIARSLDELYQSETKNSALVQAASRQLDMLRQDGAVEVASGILARRNPDTDGATLVQSALRANRGRVLYVVMWSPADEAGRQLARDAARLAEEFSPREVGVLYVAAPGTSYELWRESLVRQRLPGEHIYLNALQVNDGLGALNLSLPENGPDVAVGLVDRAGRPVRRRVFFPDEQDKLLEQIQKLL